MSMAKKCDRCGKLYEPKQELSDKELRKGAWRFNIIRDDHPYGETRIDLCDSCRDLFYFWFCNEKTSKMILEENIEAKED